MSYSTAHNQRVTRIPKEQADALATLRLGCSYRCSGRAEFYQEYDYHDSKLNHAHTSRPICAAHAKAYAERCGIGMPE